MKRVDADKLADIILSFDRVLDPYVEPYSLPMFLNKLPPDSQGTDAYLPLAVTTLKEPRTLRPWYYWKYLDDAFSVLDVSFGQLLIIPFVCLENFRKWLSGIRVNYSDPFFAGGYGNGTGFKYGQMTRCNGYRVMRRGPAVSSNNASSYEYPESAITSKTGSNRFWKLLDFPVALGEWEKDVINLSSTVSFADGELSKEICEIEGRGEFVRISSLKDVLKISGKNRSNTKVGSVSLSADQKYDINYSSVTEGNKTVSDLYQDGIMLLCDGPIDIIQGYVDNPSITAKLYISEDGTTSESNLAVSHTFSWVCAIADSKVYKLITRGLTSSFEYNYSFHTFEDLIKYREVYLTKVKNRPITTNPTTDEEKENNEIATSGAEELRSLFTNNQEKISPYNSSLPSYSFDDIMIYPVGTDSVTTNTIHLDDGKKYKVILEFNNIVGNPTVSSIELLRCKTFRRPMKL